MPPNSLQICMLSHGHGTTCEVDIKSESIEKWLTPNRKPGFGPLGAVSLESATSERSRTPGNR